MARNAPNCASLWYPVGSDHGHFRSAPRLAGRAPEL